MMALPELLQGWASDVATIPVSHLTLNSLDVQPGSVFCAVPGLHHHGLTFAPDAVDKGAAAVLYDPQGAPAVADSAVPHIAVQGLAEKLPELGARLHGHPAEQLTLVGVTGTDGKSSVVHYCAQLLRASAIPCATLGTLGLDLGEGAEDASLTTPDPLRLQALLGRARDAGMQAVAMEVSSHALAQGRVAGLPFAHVALTTLGRDHLDFHGSVAAYHAAKKRLLNWPGVQTVHLNGDDAMVRRAAKQVEQAARVRFYGAATEARWRLLSVTADSSGLGLELAVGELKQRIQLKLLGGFNAGNAMAAAALAEAAGAPVEDILQALPRLRPVCGRMEVIGAAGQPTAVVDYAHTPDALRSVLSALRLHRPRELVCVFGCGGERDRGKRPLMAAAVEELADRWWVTDDNPRREDPEQIFADMRQGLKNPRAGSWEHDRAQAIQHALEQAHEADIVLVAGKGHEDYQDLNGQRQPFSDQAVIRAALGGGEA
nr:UDP-N-acetylmuramoyl-L-alanyl-D-glutamate--2,6-diaminopimelate ligase [Oceanococcus sp. HetDA_MAG_MS8]